jgi:cell division protein FtsW (lipid II flippase)
MTRRIFTDPVAAGLTAAVLAVGLGLVYLQVAGAPSLMLAMNAAALLIGLTMVVLVHLTGNLARQIRAAGPVLGGIMLLATAAVGQPVEGAARWISMGAVTIQPSLILLPAMLVLFARERTRASAAGLALAFLAVAMQPDRAMAAMALVGAGLVLLLAPDRRRFLWLAPVGLVAFIGAMARPDRLPASAFVDQILYSAPALSAIAGSAVLGGSVLLIAPALMAATGHSRLPLLVFGGAWATALAAAALGNYPTPLVGYGGSAILGYCLSVAVLRRRPASAAVELKPSGIVASNPRPPSGMALAHGPES